MLKINATKLKFVVRLVGNTVRRAENSFTITPFDAPGKQAF